MKNRFAAHTVFLLAVVGSLVLLNVIALRAFARFDVTRERNYTLSKASKETMSGLEEPVTVTAYFTENLPAPYSSNARYVRDLLEEFRAASKGKLSFEFIDPTSQETEKDKETKKDVKQDIFGRQFREQTRIEKELATAGVPPVEIRVVEEDKMQTRRAYMGLVLSHQEKKEVIPVIQDTGNLEYDLTSLVRKMVRPKTPVVGLLRSSPEPGTQEKLNKLQVVLSQTNEVRPLELGSADRVPADFDAVLVVGPKTALKPNEVKAIDQFLMDGKAVGFFLDAIQVDSRTFAPTDVEHGLTALLASYGITLGDKLVADVSSAQLNVQERQQFMVVTTPVPYPFVPLLKRLEGDSPVSKGLRDLAFPFVTPVTAASGDGREVKVLARSSAKSWLENKPFNIDPRRNWRGETLTTTGPYDLMVQVSGKLKSHFAAEASGQSSGGAAPLMAESKGEPRIIVIGGSTLFQDDFMNEPNQALLLNVSDWLLLDPALLAMRSRGRAGAPLQAELSDSVRNGVKFGNTLGLPLLLVGFGVIRWRVRESKRSRATV